MGRYGRVGIACTIICFFFIGITSAILSGYGYYQDATINNAGASNLTNYQMKFVVNTSSGTSSGTTLYLNSHSESDLDDLRFTATDDTIYSYWIESTSNPYTVWVNLTTVPVGNSTMRVQYGYPSATKYSSGTTTFPLFDDFNDGLVGGSGELTPDVVISNGASNYEAWPNIAKNSTNTWFVVYRTTDTNVHGVCSTGRMVMRTSTNNGTSWSAESTVVDRSGIDDKGGGILCFNNSSTWTLLVNYYEGVSGDEDTYVVKSTNWGSTWGSKIGVASGSRRATYSNPILLSNGNIVFATYDVATWSVYIEESSDGGDTWTEYLVGGNSTIKPDEASIIETKTGGIYTGGIYLIARSEAAPYTYYYSTSTDYGHTWAAFSAEDTGQISPPSVPNPPSLFRLSNDHVLMSYTDEYDIVVYESSDECVTWALQKQAVSRDSYTEPSHYSHPFEISSTNVSFVWCTNREAFYGTPTDSEVYLNYIDYPFISANNLWDTSGTVTESGGLITGKIGSKSTYGSGYATRSRSNVTAVDKYVPGWADAIAMGKWTMYRSYGYGENKWAKEKYPVLVTTRTVAYDTNFHIFDIGKVSTTGYFIMDTTDDGTLTSCDSSATKVVRYNSEGYTDWVLVRQYTTTEPTGAAWSGESSGCTATAPVAAFHANVTSGYTPLSVGFTDDSTNTPTSWAWSWGDGTANGTTQNPSHTYTSSGTFNVTLTSTNCAGSDGETKLAYIAAYALNVFPGCTNYPTDLDADGLYEDINGNSRKDWSDIILFFKYRIWAAANEPPAAFDWNSNGVIDYKDVLMLYDEGV